MQNSILSVVYQREHNVSSSTYTERRTVNLSTQAIQNGLIEQLGTTNFTVLMAIVSFCDYDGEAFPSQRKLAQVTGLSLPTVNKAVNSLLGKTFNGVPLLTRRIESLGGKNNFSVYTLKEEQPKENKITARDYVIRFKDRFQEEYGFAYVVNYGRDTSLVKKKLMAEYSHEEIDKIMNYVFENYSTKHANKNYPYPSIAVMCGWLGNTAIQSIKQQEKELEQLEIRYQGQEEACSEALSQADRLFD